MKDLIKDWDKFYSHDYKDITGRIGTNIKTDQFSITFDLLKKFHLGDRILEAGCGLGSWVFILSKMGFDVCGIDISRVSLDAANNYGKNNNLKYKLLLADLRKIPVQDNYFDLVVSYGAIEHFSDSLNAFREFFRVLRPGGACLVTTPNPFSFHRLIGRYVLNITKSRKLGYVGYERAFTPKSLAGMLKESGFNYLDYGILTSGMGCLFGNFWLSIPFCGKYILKASFKLAHFIEKRQSSIGGGSFAIGYKRD